MSRLFLSIGLMIMSSIASEIKTSKSSKIFTNQIGFYTTGPKILIAPKHTKAIQISAVNTTTPERSIALDTTGRWEAAVGSFNRFDLTKVLQKPGEYVVFTTEEEIKIRVGDSIHTNTLKSVLKSFYFQRADAELTEEFAGPWKRQANPQDTQALIHRSAASEKRPEGTAISTPKGWYDAGDYGRYIVNSAITVYQLLKIHEEFPILGETLKFEIPTSQHGLPDLLEEIKYNLDWMLSMQDPVDGGVYHKATTLRFDGEVMPIDSKADRYVVYKSTGATLGFSAVMAMASRLYKTFLPEFSETCLRASEKAYKWAKKNPAILYSNPGDVHTGPYTDEHLSDEFFWASTELFLATGDCSYEVNLRAALDDSLGQEDIPVPYWGRVWALGAATMAAHPEPFKMHLEEIKKKMKAPADKLVELMDKSIFKVGMSSKDFVWGSNSHATNCGFYLLQAAKLHPESAKKYQEAALHFLDYTLGKNPHGKCMITGQGTYSPLHIHHRPSEADKVDAPVPGFLVGGPHNGGQDIGSKSWQCQEYRNEQYPANSWTDQHCSYATNEIAINWSSSIAYLLASMDQIWK